MAQYFHIWCVVSRGLGLKLTAVSEEDRPRLAALISRLRQLREVTYPKARPWRNRKAHPPIVSIKNKASLPLGIMLDG
jgi:hypothetical protein